MTRRRQHQRMAYLGTLAGGLAHEIRNPLSAMKVNLQLLREDLERKGADAVARAARRAEVLEKAIHRLEAIVNDFLKFARGFDLTFEAADLNLLVEEVVVFVEPEAREARIDLRTAYDRSLPRVRVDRKYLQQALLNLFLNARQAIEESGRPGELFVTTRRAGDEAVIAVTDTGPGIAPDVLPRIFDAYFSTKKGGTGLGLPTCRRIVEEHGGTVTVESEVDKGSSFTLTLPLNPPEKEPSE
ncbi:MAG: two-component sensor histidine kinase [Planctomycetes bacterium]|nr:two-component sensor histidine kinase [Planctomycetota bacterium]